MLIFNKQVKEPQHNGRTPYTPFSGIQGNVGTMDIPSVISASPEELGSMPDSIEAQIAAFDATQQGVVNPYAGFEGIDPVNIMQTNMNSFSSFGAKNPYNTFNNPSVDVTDGTKGYEGYRSKVYTDTTGNATVGYGHKLTAAEIKSGKYANGITQEQGEALYAQDRAKHNAQFYKREPWAKDLNASQREALEDMAFNMGPGFLDKFSNNRTLMQQGNFHAAASSFEQSKYAKQVGRRAYDNAARLRM